MGTGTASHYKDQSGDGHKTNALHLLLRKVYIATRPCPSLFNRALFPSSVMGGFVSSRTHNPTHKLSRRYFTRDVRDALGAIRLLPRAVAIAVFSTRTNLTRQSSPRLWRSCRRKLARRPSGWEATRTKTQKDGFGDFVS